MAHQNENSTQYLLLLSLSALGVVYGDIGTSPLYALRESFHHTHGIPVTPENVLGILSLIFWSLILIVSIKYLAFVLRADNRGEGGILALTALVTPVGAWHSKRSFLIILGLFGTALLYGDGIITPAISVLSAVEGLHVATPALDELVVPITIVILIGLFSIQKHGTAGVGRIFGPVTLLWFATLAALGIHQVLLEPHVAGALNPSYALGFVLKNGWNGFVTLGSIFLAVTGAEALYADLGHFGKRPIRLAWFTVVLPSLVLNYFGQGALLLRAPEAIEHPFYHMAPDWAQLPLVLMATVATVIASQALITGAFSLTRQASQLGYIPRIEIQHTSEREIGQIYVPPLNWVLMLACIGLVVGFRSSSRLAAAYGLAVTSTMVITTLMFYVVARERWQWRRWHAAAVAGVFLVPELAFLGANLIKIPHGGWFPLVVALFVFTLITTWKRGRGILAERLRDRTVPLETFLTSDRLNRLTRIPGTAAFLYSNPTGTPPALMHSLDHYSVLHERIILLSVQTKEVPHLVGEDRVSVETLGKGFYRIRVRYGFMEDPDLPSEIRKAVIEGQPVDPHAISYFLGREVLIPSPRPGMAIWREKLFAGMSRNARTATSFFKLPPERVVELGTQIEI